MNRPWLFLLQYPLVSTKQTIQFDSLPYQLLCFNIQIVNSTEQPVASNGKKTCDGLRVNSNTSPPNPMLICLCIIDYLTCKRLNDRP